MRLKASIILCTLALALMSVSPSTERICEPGVESYGEGEFVKMKVYYNWKSVWLRAGTATLEVFDDSMAGKPAWHVKATGKSYKTYNWFYKVHDVYESYIDRSNGAPLKFRRDVYEGGFTIYEDYTFDWDKHKLTTLHEDSKHPRRVKEFGLADCTQDLISAMYNTRCFDYSGLEVGDKVPIDIFLDEKPYSLFIQYLGKETVKTDAGTFRCVKARPLLIKGRIFDEVNAMTIYVTDDDNRIPVMIETPLSVGSVKALLVDHKGLKHPLSAKI